MLGRRAPNSAGVSNEFLGLNGWEDGSKIHRDWRCAEERVQDRWSDERLRLH